MADRSENRHTTALLTAAEAAVIEREAERREPKASKSAVMNEAIVAYLHGRDLGAEGLRMPSTRGEKTAVFGYMLAPATLALLDRAKAEHGFQFKWVMRAAVAALAEREPR